MNQDGVYNEILPEPFGNPLGSGKISLYPSSRHNTVTVYVTVYDPPRIGGPVIGTWIGGTMPLYPPAAWQPHIHQV